MKLDDGYSAFVEEMARISDGRTTRDLLAAALSIVTAAVIGRGVPVDAAAHFALAMRQMIEHGLAALVEAGGEGSGAPAGAEAVN